MTARDIPGWSTDVVPWAQWISSRIPHGGTYLEVGVFLGASLAAMGELRPDINLIAVDPWDAAPAPGWVGVEPSIFASTVAPHGSLFMAFLNIMRQHASDTLRRTKVIRGSASTVVLLEKVDMLFIDGAHDYDNVMTDLHAFAPLVRKGGIISGHDYDHTGVSAAVDEYLGCKPNRGTPDGRGINCWWTT
jgi:hypothetical protein